MGYESIPNPTRESIKVILVSLAGKGIVTQIYQTTLNKTNYMINWKTTEIATNMNVLQDWDTIVSKSKRVTYTHYFVSEMWFGISKANPKMCLQIFKTKFQ